MIPPIKQTMTILGQHVLSCLTVGRQEEARALVNAWTAFEESLDEAGYGYLARYDSDELLPPKEIK